MVETLHAKNTPQIPKDVKDDLPASSEFLIIGITSCGKKFRPHDWAERLAGVMGIFGSESIDSKECGHYSSWCLPIVSGDHKCVIVRRELALLNRAAWDFVIGFAKDNDLQTTEVCLIER